jgi:hypothetical protein
LVGHSGDCSDGGVSAAISAMAALACGDGGVGAIIVVACGCSDFGDVDSVGAGIAAAMVLAQLLR